MRESWRLENVSFDTLEYLARLEAPAGYVLVAQDIELSKRYRIERTSDPKQRLDQMRQISPASLEVALILQSEDAKATEKFLHVLLRRNRSGAIGSRLKTGWLNESGTLPGWKIQARSQSRLHCSPRRSAILS